MVQEIREANIPPRKVLLYHLRNDFKGYWEQNNGGLGFFFQVDYIKYHVGHVMARLHGFNKRNLERLLNEPGTSSPRLM